MTAALVVDDSRLAQRCIKKALLDAIPDADVTCAASGEEALELVAQLGSDLAIALIDFNMPGMDGIECGKQLRKIYPDVPMALVTANVQDAVADRARDSGLLVVHKPFSKEKLHTLLSDLGNWPCS